MEHGPTTMTSRRRSRPWRTSRIAARVPRTSAASAAPGASFSFTARGGTSGITAETLRSSRRSDMGCSSRGIPKSPVSQTACPRPASRLRSPGPMEPLASGFGLLEAPRADAAGHVWFSDVTRGGVHRLAPDGTVSVVVPKRRGVGGLVLHADGGVVISGRNVVHVRDGNTRVLLAVDGVVGFNDLTTDAAGRVYVGSLRSSAFEAGPRIPGELWRVEGSERAVEVYGDVEYANGVGFSP